MSWSEVPFDSIIADSAFGPRFSGDCYADDGNVATLRTTDLSPDGFISLDTMPHAKIDEDKFESHFLQVGDLVISRSGRIGTTALFDGYHKPVLPGAFLIRFRLDLSKAHPLFFRLFFNSGEGQERLLSVAQGAAQQNINITNVRKLSVPLPPLAEQFRIATVLAAYDNLIATNQRRIALLEDAARRLYREWFVHLRFPGRESVSVKDGVPEGWEQKPLGDVAPLNYGKALRSTDRKDGKVPVFGSSGIVGAHNVALVDSGAIVVGRKGNVGSLYFSPAPCFPIDTVYYIAPAQSSYRLFLALHQLNFISSDAAVPGLNRAYAHSLPVLQPSDDVAEAFERLVRPVFEQAQQLAEQNAQLAQARDLLLPKLMSGQLDVSGIQLPEEIAA